MTKLSEITFEPKEVVKMIAFVSLIGSMWYDLKTTQVVAQEERRFIQYQIDELKRISNNATDHRIAAVFVRPVEPRREKERKFIETND